ncbi:MAG: DUF72 domain-containing protein [Pyrinomonadaceae bacterium]
MTPLAARKPVFYPNGTRSPAMLELYARVFSSIEVDSTFYAIPTASTVDNWAGRTPDDFTFSLKLPQEVTHVRALYESVEIVNEFCERARRLKAKLAVVLVQLPPHFVYSPENARTLAAFLKTLPRDVRFAVEFRGNAWLSVETLTMLENYHVALALVDSQWLSREKIFELAEKMTCDFAYIRWMGARDLTRFDIVQRPQDTGLRAWSELIERLAKRTSNIYAYFSNYYEGHAPLSANKLKRLLGQKTVEAKDLEDQPSLF